MTHRDIVSLSIVVSINYNKVQAHAMYHTVNDTPRLNHGQTQVTKVTSETGKSKE